MHTIIGIDGKIRTHFWVKNRRTKRVNGDSVPIACRRATARAGGILEICIGIIEVGDVQSIV